jgi:hypothetical protein
MKLREGLFVALDGIRGRVEISAEDKGEDGHVIWVTCDGSTDETDDNARISIGVDPLVLVDAIRFVRGQA